MMSNRDNMCRVYPNLLLGLKVNVRDVRQDQKESFKQVT